ncbi:zinc finger E-box-binding homeobox 1 [Amyelois transitella]|uniref:zinc finger E-box-binding homeobox 1 n=1 Tax=Amyelois transitella TaxID=680683 RepID=UPI00067AEE93|nr:zinc finger E-box-binding homeobox 1 [Amyelois transitella]
MNFATFSTVGTAGTHFVTTSGQLPVTKLQQNMSNNGTSLSQVVGMVGGVGMAEGVQYVQAAPQIISVPIALPGAKPGDPQQTIQIQVLNPNLTLQPQQQKFQMQIPGFQQGGAVLTVAYSPENNDNGGIQLVQHNAISSDGQLQLLLPQDMQMAQQQTQDTKEPLQHQVFITPNQQIIINSPEEAKLNNNNVSSGVTSVVVKEECEDMDEDENSQDAEVSWDSNANQDLIKYLNTLPAQQTQALPVSLQQFLRLNTVDKKPDIQTNTVVIQMEQEDDKKEEPLAEAVLGEDGTLKIIQNKKKKKYKKKPPRPARPKPGQVVIATAEDGTPIYCCPECSMAYPEKEQLEMHLIVHKIERRYICGICGAGLKRKEHLERHKMGHNPERPYVCGVCNKGFKRREHLNLHTVIHSGVKTEMCTECGKGFYRKDHLRKHMRFHENKRARDEAAADHDAKPAPTITTTTNSTTLLPEITIHVPTSSNVQVPVQINIPPHVVTSLAAAHAHAPLDALLAQHT